MIPSMKCTQAGNKPFKLESGLIVPECLLATNTHFETDCVVYLLQIECEEWGGGLNCTTSKRPPVDDDGGTGPQEIFKSETERKIKSVNTET